MLRRLLLTVIVGVFVIAGVAGYASALDQPIGTKISLIKPAKLYKIVSKPTTTPLFTLPAGALSVLGGSVTVTVNDGTLTCALAAQAYDGTEGWKGLGNPSGSKGWKYLNNLAPGGGTAGACKLVLIKEKVIKVLAKDTGGLVVLGPGLNSDVAMQLDAGDDSYCALATPPHSKEVAGSLLKTMKDEPAPARCPEIGAHKCVLAYDEVTPANGSNVRVSLQAGPFPRLPVSGSLDIVCGVIDPATGKAPCECNIQELDPIDFAGLGFICFSPGSGCPMGEIDCDGGNALNVDLVSDHILGPCMGKPDCVAQCTASCGAGFVQNAGCEGFCNGGTNDGAPCVTDPECPGGSCPGTEPQSHGNICNCDCVTVDGAPTPAGTLQCNVATSVNVELAPPCDGTDVMINVGRQCIPVTAGTFTSIMHNANNTPGKDFPVGGRTATGVPLGSCEDLAASMTTDLELVGGANFYDSLIGDLSVSARFVCQ